MLKALFILILLYYGYKTARNLVRAALGGTPPPPPRVPPQGRQTWHNPPPVRTPSHARRDIEDARFEDIKD